MIRRLGLRLLGVAALALCWAPSASADLFLSFDQSTYTIAGVGQTTAVEVFVSQGAGGPQVGVGNELISAAIELSYPTASGVAAVLLMSDVTGGPSWDSASPSLGTSGSNSVVDLALTSILGIGDLTSPLLLGTFTFTGLSFGSMPISVSQLDPNSSDFITAGGDVLDPTNTPGASIRLRSVPEPASAMLLSIAALAICVRRLRRRRSSKPVMELGNGIEERRTAS